MPHSQPNSSATTLGAYSPGCKSTMGRPLEHVSVHKQPPQNKSRHGEHAPEYLEDPCPHVPTAHWTRKRLRTIFGEIWVITLGFRRGAWPSAQSAPGRRHSRS